MCIKNSVGTNGHNAKPDVKCVQLLLNMNLSSCGEDQPLAVDGLSGRGTARALSTFQSAIGVSATGRVEPGDETMEAFRQRLPAGLTREKLQAIMPSASTTNINRFFEPVVTALQANAIDTPLRMAHFLAQVGHECADFLYQEEIASGSAYEGRKDLGNTETGDGRRFKGRGLIQLTGRTNYTHYGKARNRDFISGNNPNLIAQDPTLAIDVACWYWTTRNLNHWADQDNVRELTRRINGGYNGLDDRTDRLVRARWFLGA